MNIHINEKIPSVKRFISAVMITLLKKEQEDTQMLYQEVANTLQLSETQMKILVEDKKEALYKNRTRWVIRQLEERGYIESRERGVWKIKSDAQLYIDISLLK